MRSRLKCLEVEVQGLRQRVSGLHSKCPDCGEIIHAELEGRFLPRGSLPGEWELCGNCVAKPENDRRKKP